MATNVFYERRKESVSIDGSDRRVVERRNGLKTFSPERRRVAAQVRRYERVALSLPVLLKIQKKEVSGYTKDIGPEGLSVLSDSVISPGTPMSLQFSFGGVCYLNISGQVVFDLPAGDGISNQHAIGIKFCGIREWEQKIMSAAVQELKQSATTQEKSLLTVLASKDGLAIEAASFSIRTKETLEEGAKTVPPSFDYPLFYERKDVQIPTRPTPQVQPVKVSSLDWLLPTFKLLLNGEDLDTGKYEYFPYSDQLIADFRTTIHAVKQLKSGIIPENYKKYIFARYCVGKEDTNLKAMEAAHEASKEFRYFPLSKRLKILTDVYEFLLANKEKLIELMIIEGHPRRLAEWEFSGMEHLFRKQSLDFYKDNMSRRVGIDGQEVLYWKRNPDGVVCVSPPKNAPCSSSLIAGFALLGGNTLIVKPPLRTPISTSFLWRNIVHEALRVNGAPPGTLNIVLGHSKSIMNEWITSPYVNDILFFGDSKTGLEIGNRAYKYGKKPILELSGNDMMFIWKDAQLDEAVQSLLDGFLGSMQICMVPKKAFIHEDIYEEFETRFLAEVKQLKIGFPSDPEVSLTPVIRINEFYDFLEDGLQQGAKLLCGGMRVNHQMIPDKNGSFITPTVIRITNVAKAHEMKCVKKENFFPLMPLIKVSAKDARNKKSTKDMAILKTMVIISNSNEYGLRASVWVNSPFYIQKFMEHIQNSGLLRINSRHVGFSPYLATHGGTGKSGGPYGELNYVWEKTTHLQGVSLTKVKKRDQ